MGDTLSFPSAAVKQQWGSLFTGTPMQPKIESAWTLSFDEISDARGLHFLLRTAQGLHVEGACRELTGYGIDEDWYGRIVHAKGKVLVAGANSLQPHVTIYFVPEKIRRQLARSLPEWLIVTAAQMLRKLKWWRR